MKEPFADPADLATFATWLERGDQLHAELDRVLWLIADWAAHGMIHYRRDLPGIPSSAPFDAKQIRKAARASQAFPTDQRAPSLPFGVHELLLRLPGDDRAEQFTQAKAEGWTVRHARAAVTQRRQEAAMFVDDDPERLATHIYRAWNNAPAEIREHAWTLLEAGAERGFALIDEEETLA
jgi:hypothetical protein